MYVYSIYYQHSMIHHWHLAHTSQVSSRLFPINSILVVLVLILRHRVGAYVGAIKIHQISKTKSLRNFEICQPQ